MHCRARLMRVRRPLSGELRTARREKARHGAGQSRFAARARQRRAAQRGSPPAGRVRH